MDRGISGAGAQALRSRSRRHRDVDCGLDEIILMKTGAFKITLLAFAVFLIAGLFLMDYLQDTLRGTTMTLRVDLYPRWVGAQSILEGESPCNRDHQIRLS